jgi:hypothetical protein
MRTLIIFIGLGLALLGGFWWRHHHPAHPAPVNASIYETDMVESLVREILVEFQPPLPAVCFLAFGDGTTSPSPEFIARFEGSQPAVRRYGSAADPPTGTFFETSTGRPGLVVHIVRFKEYIADTFDVEVSFSNLPPGHDRFNYRLTRLGGEWRVERRQPA